MVNTIPQGSAQAPPWAKFRRPFGAKNIAFCHKKDMGNDKSGAWERDRITPYTKELSMAFLSTRSLTKGERTIPWIGDALQTGLTKIIGTD